MSAGQSAGVEIVSLAADVPLETSQPSTERLIDGDPVQKIANHYSDASGQFFAGRWSSTVGKWRVRYTEHELCIVTRGRIVLQSASGVRSEFGPGSAFVVPAGFEGVWQVVEPCTKIYAIFEPRTE